MIFNEYDYQPYAIVDGSDRCISSHDDLDEAKKLCKDYLEKNKMIRRLFIKKDIGYVERS